MRLTSTVAVCVGLLTAAGAVRADDFIVYSPHVFESQSEVEVRGYRFADSRSDLGGSAAELSIAHGVTGWWKPEFYLAEFEKVPGTRGYFKGFEFENTFQFTPPGKYVADFGFLAAYEHNIAAGVLNAIEFGPLIEKTAGRFAHRANFIWEKALGTGASGRYQLRYSYSGTYSVSQAFRPGLEAYGRPGDRAYQAGPIVAGEHHIPGTAGNLEYRIGMVAGINAAAPRQTWLMQLEYEFF
jgi:hypothetical protein